jgi:hypothetical protein
MINETICLISNSETNPLQLSSCVGMQDYLSLS